MKRYLVRRLAGMGVVLLVVSLVTFSLIHITGGDPIEIMLGGYPTPELIQATKKLFGLDQPLHIQYLTWLWNLLHGDLGISIRTKELVTDMIAQRFPITLLLVGTALLISLIIAIPAGIISGVKHRTKTDYTVMSFALLGVSVPNFLVAIILILVFSVELRLLPTSGSLILPALALGLPFSAITTRMLRSSMLETLHKQFITVLRAKGLPERAVILRHALKNSILPVISTVSLQFGIMLGEAAIIEYIFAIPGTGNLLIRAVFQRDIPVIQGIVLVITLAFLLSTLVADLLYSYVNPKVRYD